MELLLHVTEYMAPLLFRNILRTLTKDTYLSRIWRIEAEHQLKDRTLSAAGSANQRHHLTGVDTQRKVMNQRLLRIIRKRHMFQIHGCRRIFSTRSGSMLLFRMRHEGSDPGNAGGRRLNILNFHADIRQRTKHVVHIGNRRHCRTGSHAEERGPAAAHGRQRHHDRNHDGARRNNDRRIDGVIEIRLFHRIEAAPDRRIVQLLHIGGGLIDTDRAPVFNRLRNLIRKIRHRLTIIQLRLPHPLLTMPRKQKQHRQRNQQKQTQSLRKTEHNHQNAGQRTKVRNHTDDAIIKQRLNRIHVVDKQ